MHYMDRNWAPSGDEQDSVAELRETEPGQVLLRLIDHQMHEYLPGLLARNVDAQDSAQIAFQQGKYAAFQLVMSWLLKERDLNESQKEENDG